MPLDPERRANIERMLLGAAAEHPVTLFCLENWQSVAPDSPAARHGRNARGLSGRFGLAMREIGVALEVGTLT